MRVQELAFELEKHMMSWCDLETSGCPEEFVNAAKAASSEGVPTGYGRHPEYGWFVIWSAGQGPGIDKLETWPEGVVG
jgi:hypothetical protein